MSPIRAARCPSDSSESVIGPSVRREVTEGDASTLADTVVGAVERILGVTGRE